MDDGDRAVAVQSHGLANCQSLARNAEQALHLERHGLETAAEAQAFRRPIGLPGSERRLAVETVKHAVEGAGIAAVGEQDRPAAGVAGQPGRLVAHRIGLQRRELRLPRRRAEDRGAQALVLDRGDGAADLGMNTDTQCVALQHHGIAAAGAPDHHAAAHLTAPAMRPRMKYFWKAM